MKNSKKISQHRIILAWFGYWFIACQQMLELAWTSFPSWGQTQ